MTSRFTGDTARSTGFSLVVAATLGLAPILAGGAALATGPTVITLTQVGCQFLESENGVNLGFKPTKKADCDAINARTGKARLAKAKILELKPGKYIFRVTNRDVPYPLGFWLRSYGYNWLNPIDKLTKTSVSGGGLTMGTSRDYAVDLKPGKYTYSCPLNTTPNYTLIVKG